MAKCDFEPGFSGIVEVVGAYDHLTGNGKSKRADAGHHGVELRFTLKGPSGAVSLTVFTDWMLASSREWLEKRFPDDAAKRYPTMATVVSHSPTQLHEHMTRSRDACPYVEGGTCYGDVSFSMSDDWLEDFIAGGTDFLWPKLREVYRDWLEPANPEGARGSGGP
jgi:hypothetical protein